MQMKIEEITYRRVKEKCYLIEDVEGKYFIIYGTRFREVNDGDELYTVVRLFLKEDNDLSWRFIHTRIKHDRDEGIKELSKSKWLYLNDVKDRILDVGTLFVDGEKKI